MNKRAKYVRKWPYGQDCGRNCLFSDGKQVSVDENRNKTVLL